MGNSLIVVKMLAACAVALIALGAFMITGLPEMSMQADVSGGGPGTAPPDADAPVLAIRTDLSGPGPFMVGHPVFVEVSDRPEEGSEAMLDIRNASLAEVEVLAFEPDRLSTPWEAAEVSDGVQGNLSIGDEPVLLVVLFSTPGTYEMELTPVTEADRGSSRSSAMIEIQDIEDRLFYAPRTGEWAGSTWNETVGNDTSMGFSVEALTTSEWEEEPWTSYYNWTVTVFNPEGMVVGGDLSRYNTGEQGVDTSALNGTSVVSAWENGFNTQTYTLWNRSQGQVMSGDAAMAPTAKEITYGSSAWNEWTQGTWMPFGAGHITFHQPGHYLFVLALTEGGREVSPPLVLEVLVV